MTRLALVGARIEAPFGSLDDATILIEDGRIVQVGPREAVIVNDARRLEAGGLLAVPGFIDLHAHGALGVDYFGAPTGEIERVLEWLPSTGVTSRCRPPRVPRPRHSWRRPPPWANWWAGAGQARAYSDSISRGRGLRRASAAHNSVLRSRPPDVEEFKRVQDAAGGHVRMVTLAPKQPGAPALISAPGGHGGHRRGRAHRCDVCPDGPGARPWAATRDALLQRHARAASP